MREQLHFPKADNLVELLTARSFLRIDAPRNLNAGDRPSFAGPDKFAMADKKQAGKTDKPETVEIDVTDEASLAEALAAMELEVPQEVETPKESTAEAAEDDDTEEVLSQTNEETEAEAEPAADESATDAEDEAAEDEDADDAEDAPDDSNTGYQKRIDKLTKRAKGAEERESSKDERIAKLESELAAKEAEPSAQVPAAPATPTHPFTNATKMDDILREEHNAEQVLDWADSNPDGALVQTSDGELEYSAEEVRDIRKRASKALRKWLPERKQWIRENHAQDEYAHATYKWWTDKSTAEYQAAMNVIREFPEIQRFPDYKVIVGDTLVGMHMRLSAHKDAKAPKAVKPKKAPKQPGKPTAEPAPVEESTARSAAARQAFDESGNVEDLARVLAAGDMI